jgi:hypothetical protein
MTTATISPTGQNSNGVYVGKAALTETNWHKSGQNWVCLHRNNVELVAYTPSDPTTPWHCYVQRGQRGPSVHINSFADMDKAMDWFTGIDGAYPALPTDWTHNVETVSWQRTNLGKDRLIILQTKQDRTRPFHCFIARFRGKQFGHSTPVMCDRRPTLQSAMDFFLHHPAG